MVQYTPPTNQKYAYLLHGRYRVLKVIGKGGQAKIFCCRDTFSKKLVAIKQLVISADGTGTPDEQILMFEKEALVLSLIPSNPAFPSIYNYFYDNGIFYIVMDYLEGEPLDSYIARQVNAEGICRLKDVVNFGVQLTYPLSELHNHEPPIIFRDLTPENILITPQKRIKIVDFGIARFYSGNKRQDTYRLGKPGFASPEQYGKAESDGRADVYSLGAIFHMMLTGDDPSNLPFKFRLVNRVKLTRSELEKAPDASAIVIDLVMDMVELDREKRPWMKDVYAKLHFCHRMLQGLL
jgi:serine/threonine protein kinase